VPKKKKLPQLKKTQRKVRVTTQFFLGLLLFVFLFYPGQNYYQRLVYNPGQVKGVSYTKEPLTLPLVGRAFDQKITAKAYMVFEPKTGTILLEKNSDQELTPASVTKIMTALVAKDLYEDQDSLFVTFKKAEGSVIGLQQDTSMLAADLLKALLISSANDASLVFAQNHPGGYQGFVEDMNIKAKDIGLKHSHFTNVSGIGPHQIRTQR
jgi:D-alanyl-D-alanine carboxypeptidase